MFNFIQALSKELLKWYLVLLYPILIIFQGVEYNFWISKGEIKFSRESSYVVFEA